MIPAARRFSRGVWQWVMLAGVLDQGVHVAQADGQSGDLEVVHHVLARFQATFEIKGDHPAKVDHLSERQSVVGMAGQARGNRPG